MIPVRLKVVDLYEVGDTVERDDGRFYVPVRRMDDDENVDSQIVLRVASDAFETVEEAEEFARVIVRELNLSSAVAALMVQAPDILGFGDIEGLDD